MVRLHLHTFHILDNVQFGEVIGGGGQGIVQRAIIHSKNVALKSSKFQHNVQFSGFAKEIKLLRQD